MTAVHRCSGSWGVALCLVGSLGGLLTAGAAGQLRAEPPSRNYAFLVACADYDRKELRPLQYTRPDITGFYQVLRDSGFPADQIVLMHDGQPRDCLPEAKKIRKQLDLLLARVGRQDSVIVALSGHGVQFKGEPRPYFCPVDAELKDRATLLALDEVYQKLQACPARRKLLLVDACRNDPQSGLAKSRAEVDLESVTRPQAAPVPEGIVALFSCSPGQQSFEDPDLKHGIFFHHILEGWQGAADANGDGGVTLDELVDYAKTKTQAFAHRRFNALQVPQQKGEFSGVWVLSRPSRAKVARLSDADLARVRSLFSQGSGALIGRDYRRAAAYFNDVLQINPSHRSALYCRGRARLETGDYDWAIADFTQVIQINPKWHPPYLNRGLAYAQKGDLDRAIADYTEAVRLSPDYTVAYLQRARAQAARKAYDQAVADYTQVLRLDPKYAWAYYSRGNAYFGLKAYERAVADYSEALRLDPEKAKASYLQLSSSFGPTAIAVLTPKFAWAHYNRALAYENLGDTARARQDREAAVRLDPTVARN